jgi:hypothetical protein
VPGRTAVFDRLTLGLIPQRPRHANHRPRPKEGPACAEDVRVVRDRRAHPKRASAKRSSDSGSRGNSGDRRQSRTCNTPSKTRFTTASSVSRASCTKASTSRLSRRRFSTSAKR